MSKFSSTPVQQMAEKLAEDSETDQTRLVYQKALREAIDTGQAMIVALEPEDVPYTIRSRIYAAAKAIGEPDIRVKQLGNTFVAYRDMRKKNKRQVSRDTASPEDSITLSKEELAALIQREVSEALSIAS